MKLLWIITLLVVVLLLTRREPFTEAFGFSGYKKPVGTIRFDDARPDTSSLTQGEAKVTNDMMQEFVMLTNKEILKRTKLCTYIIETTAVKKYTGAKTLYECAFMVVKNDGFAFGFSVTAMFEVEGNNTRLVSLRSQPLDVETPEDVSPYTEGSEGKEFIEYKLVKEKAAPTSSEFETTKNKLS